MKIVILLLLSLTAQANEIDFSLLTKSEYIKVTSNIDYYECIQELSNDHDADLDYEEMFEICDRELNI